MSTSNKGPAHVGRGVPKAGLACISVFLAALLAFVQPTLPGALRFTPTQSTEAHALEGTTNYSDMFHLSQRRGTPGYMIGSTLRTVSTSSKDGYVYDSNRKAWMSSAALTSNQPVSLLHDWTIECVVDKPTLSVNTSLHKEIVYQYVFGLFSNNNAESLNGRAIFMADRYDASVGYETFLSERYVTNSLASDILNRTNMSSSPTRSSVTISYSYAANSLTLKYGSYSKTMSSVRSTFPSQAYLGMWGTFNWVNKNGSTTSTQAPSGAYLDVTFKSMSMPHLEPAIQAPLVYPETGSQPYGKDAMLENGTVVRVECTVKNKYANPGSEQYPMCLKTVNDAAHPTQGVTPFIDSTHPLTVKRGSSVISSTTSANANTVLGANGTPITLVGSNEYTVTYYAKVNQTSGEAIKLSQCLSENSFRGTYYATTELFSEKALVEGPNAAAGANYSRVPAANANGWNAGPVSIEFYASDTFDEFDIKNDAGELVKTLTAGSPRWGVASDTSGVSLTYQGRNTDVGIRSTVKPDVIRIDTHTPTLAYDKATNTLTASDVPADDAHATSGIWKVIRAEKQDQSTCAAVDGRIYGAQGGVWSATQTYVPLPGTYVAVDAAGNVSGSVEVPAFGAPEITRPTNAPVGPGDDGTQDYAGPILNGPLPEATTVTNPSTGLQQTTIDETWFELVDNSMDNGDLPFGGTLDKEAAKQVIEHNYSFASPATDSETEIQLVTDVRLIDKATGKEVSSIPTDKTSQTIIQATVTDPQGNKAIVSLLYQIANEDDLPQITPKPGTPDPKDVFGELVVKGNEKEPSPLEVKDIAFVPETGKLTGHVDASVSITVQGTIATPDDIERMISNRYEASSLVGAIGEGGEGLVKGDVTLLDADGNQVTEIDLAKPSKHTAVQTFTDKAGNTTVLTVELVCKRRPSAPEVEGTAEPLDPSSEVRIDPDKAGTVDDEPYFEHDPDKPLNILDVIQTKPEGEDAWSPIAGGSNDSNGDGSGSGNGNGSGSGNGSGNEGGSGDGSGSNPGATPDQLPSNVQVTVTDEAGRPVDPTNVTDPGTYEVTVSVKDPDTDEFVVIDSIKFHVVDTSITDTDYIYKDVAKDHWGRDYIFDIGPAVINGAFNPSDVALGYMAGYAGTTNFGPQNDIIRGDAAIVVWRMAGCPDVEGDGNDPDSPKLLSLANAYHTGFADCDANPTMYYNKAIRWCASNGIVEGYGNTGLYLPQNQITREEFASIIARYAAFKGKDVASVTADLSQYPDIDDVSDWAIANMHYVVSSGIMTGKGTDEGTAQGTHGILDPQASVTRAEVAKMTYMEQPYKL